MLFQTFLFFNLALVWAMPAAQASAGETQSLVRRGPRINNGEFTGGFMDSPGACSEGSYSARFDGNTYRARFNNMQVVIRNTEVEIVSCNFIAGAMVRGDAPAPAWHYQTADESRQGRRDIDSDEGYLSVELVENPSILKQYQDLVDLESSNNATLDRRQNGLTEKLTNGISVNLHINKGKLGDVWRIQEFAFEFHK